MNSKERVLTAVNRQTPDCIPCDFQGTAVVLERLYQHFKVKRFKELMLVLGSDMIDIRGIIDPLWKGPMPKVTELSGGVFQNYLGFLTKKMQTGFGEVEEHCGFIFGNLEDVADVKNFQWPQADWFDFSNLAGSLDEYQDYAIMASGPSVYQHPTLVRGIDNLLCDMLVFPEMAECIMDGYTDFYLEYYARMFEAVGGRIDILRIADDLGMQDRPLMSLDMFRQYLKPRIKKLVDMAHSYHVKVMFHSCGSIVQFIPDLIEVGVDILDPIQTRASGMNPENLKQKFGDKICFHGSIDTQYTLPKGTPVEVKDEVRDRMKVLGDGCGFIIAPSHTVQPDVPIENIIALYECIKSYR
jgi:uroporphyrinogen decarboxylase